MKNYLKPNKHLCNDEFWRQKYELQRLKAQFAFFDMFDYFLCAVGTNFLA